MPQSFPDLLELILNERALSHYSFGYPHAAFCCMVEFQRQNRLVQATMKISMLPHAQKQHTIGALADPESSNLSPYSSVHSSAQFSLWKVPTVSSSIESSSPLPLISPVGVSTGPNKARRYVTLCANVRNIGIIMSVTGCSRNTGVYLISKEVRGRWRVHLQAIRWTPGRYEVMPRQTE
ncbi:hypothetical protein BCR39DRAFT_513232 [Naematelia encephala]|uniref:Uncharacterized protein n=1 Tax=Naematelia encephala TaxID=71784 RepID=A0A1Y2BIC6_9TREE|nr:hypothetical protein BCR39DRAFT_513232 [Naematelia encephala]